MHAYTHTRIHASTHTRTHTYTHAHIHARMHSTRTRIGIHIPFHKLGFGCIEGDIQMRRSFNGVTWYSAVLACHNLGYDLLRFDSELLSADKTLINNWNIWLDAHIYPWYRTRVNLYRKSINRHFLLEFCIVTANIRHCIDAASTSKQNA